MGSSHELPARANLEHLRNEAKQRLKDLRARDAAARLSDAQLLVAREYGLPSWRRLKAAVDDRERARVFAATREGDVAVVRQALERGFNPGTSDADGRSLHQLAKILGHTELELLMRDYQERDERSDQVKQAVAAIQSAAADGRADELRGLLDEHPDLLDARGVEFNKQTALHKAAWKNRPECVQLLLDRGADVRIRDFGDNAYALHFAAEGADLAIVRVLVEAGSDVDGEGDDHQVGVLGWATCLGKVREDVATALTIAAVEHADPSILAMLERAGTRLDLLGALTLRRYDLAGRMVTDDPARIGPDGRDTIALHLLVAKRDADGVRWLIEHGTDLNAKRALWDCNHTALHITAERGATELARMLLDAGADPGVRDDKYQATVLGWAEYCGQPEVAELLRRRGVTA